MVKIACKNFAATKNAWPLCKQIIEFFEIHLSEHKVYLKHL